MILKIDGNINKYYAQMLCMVFFPGSTFGENETSGEGIPEVTVSVSDEGGESVSAYVSMKLNDKVCEATETVSRAEEVKIATHEAIAVGRAMFTAGRELLGHIPPWGILTGIRPAKIARKLLLLGNGVIRSKRILRDEYFLNSQKAALAVTVAQNEIKVLKRAPKNACSIYISIPFCPSRCSYCSFVSYTSKKLLSLIEPYVEALCDDLDRLFDTIEKVGLSVATIYIGGGTPTTLSCEQLERIFKKISERIDTSSLLEFSLEAGRPDTITAQKLAVAKSYGVTRVSVNPQSLSDRILCEIGRKHSVEDFYRAYAIAKESGIRDINVDLIAGLPGDDFKNFSETVERIIELDPSNITVHTFCVKKASDALKNNSNIYSVTGGDAAKCVSYSQLNTKVAGYKPYYMYRQKNTVGNLENVGFSKEGHEGLYNVYMMEEVQTIFAVGAGAVTKLVHMDPLSDEEGKIVRIFSPKYPYEYLADYKLRKAGENKKKTVFDQTLEFYSRYRKEN